MDPRRLPVVAAGDRAAAVAAEMSGHCGAQQMRLATLLIAFMFLGRLFHAEHRLPKPARARF